MTAMQKQIEQRRAASHRGIGRYGRRLEPAGKGGESRRRVCAELDGTLAFVQCLGDPQRGNRLAECRPGCFEKCRNRRDARFCRPSARDEPYDRERRLTDPERRIATHPVLARVLGELNVQVRACELRVNSVRAFVAPDVEITAQRTHLRVERVDTCWRPVRKQLIKGMHARERRVHRAAPVILQKESLERVAHPASGMLTQRRSRNDCSTALINSWTCAPSSKFPSLRGPSSRISVMKELMRFA